MTRSIRWGWWLIATIAAAIGLPSTTEGAPTLESALRREFRLGGTRTQGTRTYDMITALVSMKPDGTRGEPESLLVRIEAVLSQGTSGPTARYTCRQFTLVRAGGARAGLPALRGWSYAFEAGVDSAGRTFGIDHALFRDLTDDSGQALGPEKSYLAYNSFIDFHAFCDVFSARTRQGGGIQDLRRVGQRVVHAAAHSKPPTHLAGHFLKGSYFQNGEITLDLKGLSVLDDSPCAVVGYDSGESSFRMLLEPTPGVQVVTLGASRYLGDIEVDLESNWPRRVRMHEFIISTTAVTMPGQAEPLRIPSIHERRCSIRLVDQ